MPNAFALQLGDRVKLAHPITAIVEEEHTIAVAHGGDRYPVPKMYPRLDELVRFALLIGGLNGEYRMLHRRSDAVDHGVIRQLGSVPPPVPVHTVVAPGK